MAIAWAPTRKVRRGRTRGETGVAHGAELESARRVSSWRRERRPTRPAPLLDGSKAPATQGDGALRLGEMGARYGQEIESKGLPEHEGSRRQSAGMP